MSLLNLAVARDTAHVYYDTAWAAITGAPAELIASAGYSSGAMCKGLALPSRGVFVAARGNPAFLALVAFSIIGTPGDGFDGLVDALPSYLQQRRADLCMLLRQGGVEPEGQALENEIAVVGWSDAADEMRAVVFACCDAVSDFDREDVLPGESFCAPWAEEWGGMPEVPAEPGAGQRLALRQAEHFRQAMPEGAIGGRLIRAEVQRFTMSSEVLCEF